MPTAAEFEQYRERFEDLIKEIPTASSFLEDDWSDAINGGDVERTVKKALASSGRMTTAIDAAFDELMGLCNERKILCEEWDEARATAKSTWDSDYAAWKRDPAANPYPGSEPDWPPRPGTWATPSTRY